MQNLKYMIGCEIYKMKNYPLLSMVIFGWVIILLPQTPFAATHQVGPQRTYTRLQDVTALLDPGDTVNVDGNATYTGGVKFTKAGTSSQRIYIRGIRIENKRPIISGGTNTIHFNGSDHLVFEGFEVTGGSSRGIFHQADSVIVRDVVVRDCPQQGILGADVGSGSLTLEYCEVYNCGAGSSQHQIYMTTDEVNFPGRVFRMQHCYIHDAKGGNNVKSRAERNEIYYNWIEGAFYHELELIGPDPGGVDDGWTVALKREDSDVVGNVLRKRRTAANNDSNFSVTRLGGDATGWTHGRYRFVNNTVIAGSGAVFRLFDTLESVEMHNNVFYRVNGGVNMIRAAEGEMAWSTGAPIFAGSSNWVVSGSTNVPAQWTGTKTGASPGFVNFVENDLRPTVSSPLNDSGSNLCTGPAGHLLVNPLALPMAMPPMRAPVAAGQASPRAANGAIDIGAYEYYQTAVSAPLLRVRPATNLQVHTTGRADGTVEVAFTTSAAGAATVRLFDLSGRLIATASFGNFPAGTHRVVWNCGVRFARKKAFVLVLKAGGIIATVRGICR